jgi:hypothetical protein
MRAAGAPGSKNLGGRPRFFGVNAFLQYAHRGRLAIVTSFSSFSSRFSS